MRFPFLSIEELREVITSPSQLKMKMKPNKRFTNHLKIVHVKKKELKGNKTDS